MIISDVLTERSGRVREARKLTRRRGRDKSGHFLAEGPQAVREAVKSFDGRPVPAVEVFVTPGVRERYGDIVTMALDAGVAVHDADEAALAGLSETVSPQGIVAVCRTVVVPDTALAVPSHARLVAVLVEGQDPGNVGTVIRCADAAGADAVVLTSGSADPQGGKAVRASAGSVFHLPIVVGVPASGAIDVLRSRGLIVLAARGDAETDLDHADELLARPTAWLLGNEARGLSDEITNLTDHSVAVPIYGRAESLNLASAAAVCLYASSRVQRRNTP